VHYSWLLFDADGTLFDFDLSAANSLELTFRELGVPFREEYRGIYEKINLAAWRRFEAGELTQDELRTSRFREFLESLRLDGDPTAFGRVYLSTLSEQRDLMPGAEKTLAELKTNANMAIITNGIAEVQRSRFSRSPILRHFSDVVISEEVGAAKPDAKIFDAAFDRMGAPDKSKVLMIGDSWNSDIRGGVNYGLDTCWFNPSGRERPDDLSIRFEVRSLPELVVLLSST